MKKLRDKFGFWFFHVFPENVKKLKFIKKCPDNFVLFCLNTYKNKILYQGISDSLKEEDFMLVLMYHLEINHQWILNSWQKVQDYVKSELYLGMNPYCIIYFYREDEYEVPFFLKLVFSKQQFAVAMIPTKSNTSYYQIITQEGLLKSKQNAAASLSKILDWEKKSRINRKKSHEKNTNCLFTIEWHAPLNTKNPKGLVEFSKKFPNYCIVEKNELKAKFLRFVDNNGVQYLDDLYEDSEIFLKVYHWVAACQREYRRVHFKINYVL